MKTVTVSTSPAYVRCTYSHDNRFKKGKVYKTYPGVYKQGYVYIKPEIDSPISDYPLIGGYWKFEPCEGPETSEKEVFGKFIIGDIVVSLRNNKPYREEGDMFRVLPDSKQDVLYYKPSTNSQLPGDWRLATTKECDAFNNGVKNIKQMEAPKETVVKHAIPSNAKKWAAAKVLAFITGDKDAILAARNEKLAKASINGQISALESEKINAEIAVDSAKENLEKAIYPSVLIANQEGYYKNIIGSQEALLEAQEKLDSINKSIDFAKELLATRF